MTELPFADVAKWKWRWMQTRYPDQSHTLHRIASGEPEEDEFVGVRNGSTVCGLAGTFQMPGMFSRMGAPRCVACCDVLGIEPGDGAPFNSGQHGKEILDDED